MREAFAGVLFWGILGASLYFNSQAVSSPSQQKDDEGFESLPSLSLPKTQGYSEPVTAAAQIAQLKTNHSEERSLFSSITVNSSPFFCFSQKITPYQAKTFSEVFHPQEFDTIKYLILAKNPLEDKGVAALLPFFRKSEWVILNDTKITGKNEEEEYLRKFITVTPSLQGISLRGNPLNSTVLENLFTDLEKTSKIQVFLKNEELSEALQKRYERYRFLWRAHNKGDIYNSVPSELSHHIFEESKPKRGLPPIGVAGYGNTWR